MCMCSGFFVCGFCFKGGGWGKLALESFCLFGECKDVEDIFHVKSDFKIIGSLFERNEKHYFVD